MTPTPTRLQKPPPNSVRTIRASLGSLLLAEKSTTKALRETVRDASDRLHAEAGRQHDERILILILLSSKQLSVDLERDLHESKRVARDTGAKRLQMELRAAGSLAAIALLHSNRKDVQVKTSAEALALAWRQRAVYLALRSGHAGTSPAAAMTGLAKSIDPNVVRTARTETAQAYNDGHVEASKGVDVSGIMDRWDAMLEACGVCADMDGDLTPLGEPFTSGEEPGYVHPHCRCARTAVAVN
jgi:hypothetical protein